MDGLGNLVEGNVGATVIIFTVLWAALVVQGQILLWMGKRELARIWASETAQNDRLEEIEKEVHGEETDIAVIKERITTHIEDEEEVWADIRDIKAQLPNGDLKTAMVKLDGLITAFNALATEVRAHNTEAERWKRKIDVQDVRIATLEKRGAG